MANQRDVVTTVITNDMGCVVEVRKCADLVRCKDCIHRDDHCGMGDHKWCIINNGSTAPDDYCSFGERREP